MSVQKIHLVFLTAVVLCTSTVIGAIVLDAKDSENENTVQNDIRALRKELFKNRAYDPMARPVLNLTHPTNVVISLELLYITELNAETNRLHSEGVIYLTWIDQHLKWESADFGNIGEICVTTDEVFRPDITLTNSVQPQNIVYKSTHTDLVLMDYGGLFWWPALSMETNCEMDLTEWPFDHQECQYSFFSWNYNTAALDLINETDHIRIKNLQESPEWRVHETGCHSEKAHFDGQQFSAVICWLQLQRKTTVYRYTVYLPVLCALMLNLCSLLLDTQSWLRFRLSGLSFLTLVLEQLYLANRLGLLGGATVPKVVIYVSQMMVLVALTCIWSAFAVNFIKSRLTVPSTVMRTLEPVQPWLVNIEVTAPGQSRPPPQSNVVFVRIADKVLCALFAILMIGLHN